MLVISRCALEYDIFFQAEDGIRDYKVTGVQTCALPIFDGQADVPVGEDLGQRRDARAAGLLMEGGNALPVRQGHVQIDVPRPSRTKPPVEPPMRLDVHPRPTRSEERRVGKECRSRWSPY